MCTGNIIMTDGVGELVAVYPCVHREHTVTDRQKVACTGLSLCAQGTCEDRDSPCLVDPVYPCVHREHVNVRRIE